MFSVLIAMFYAGFLLSDSEKDIDEYEQTWASSHRALALDKEKDSGKKGGYLKVWPEELEVSLSFAVFQFIHLCMQFKYRKLKKNYNLIQY